MIVLDKEEKIVEAQQEVPESTEMQPAPEGYKPRPVWQVWAARIGLAVFVIFLIMYYINIFRGGA